MESSDLDYRNWGCGKKRDEHFSCQQRPGRGCRERAAVYQLGRHRETRFNPTNWGLNKVHVTFSGIVSSVSVNDNFPSLFFHSFPFIFWKKILSHLSCRGFG